MIDFIEERLLEKIAYGSETGSAYNTKVIRTQNGFDRRKVLWAAPLGRFSIAYSMLRPAQRELVMKAHHACRGRAVGFRFRDSLDYTATDQPLGIATGAEQTVQLTKTYTFGTHSVSKPIKKPVASTVTVYADGVEIPATVDGATGLVTFTAAEEAVITWSGEFDKPVCFADDDLGWSIDTKEGGIDRLASTSCDLEEIRV